VKEERNYKVLSILKGEGLMEIFELEVEIRWIILAPFFFFDNS